jgi:hypothetical protein
MSNAHAAKTSITAQTRISIVATGARRQGTTPQVSGILFSDGSSLTAVPGRPILSSKKAETGVVVCHHDPGEADTIVPALAKLAEMKEVKEGSYEVRLLDIDGVTADSPSVYVLWLKCDEGGKDYIYPVAISGTRNLPVWEEKLYPQEEFFKITKPLAEQAQRILTTRPFSFDGAPQQ